MSSPSDQLKFQLDSMHDLVAGVKPDQWTNTTPCDGWAVRDVVNHLALGGTMFAASFRGDTMEIDPENPEPDILGENPLAVIDAVRADLVQSMDSPGAMDRDAVLPFATLPAQVAVDIARFDVLVHLYDIAVSTGQPFDPPADVCDNGRQTAEMIVPGLRDGKSFGDENSAPAGATPIQQLAAFSGRKL